jgi:outer membrane protein assembly factor BamB
MYRSSLGLSLLLPAVLALVAAFSCTKKKHAADVPTVPVGRDSCFVDSLYAYKVIVTDPDGDSVAVRFDWGDSAVSNWSDLSASGDTAALTHAWSNTGTYEVRAQARDKGLESSDWSAALVVEVFVARPAPGAPAKPDGPAKGVQNTSYTYHTVAFHPDNMDLAIRFAWGDGDTSDWSGFVAPGESVSASHTWPITNTYVVTAQAKDTGNATSKWSAPQEVRIWPPDTMELWRYKLAAQEGLSFYSSPAIGSNGAIVAGSPDGSLYAVNADGTLRWKYTTGNRIWSSPAIAPDGTIYVGSYDDTLYAVNSDGTLRWRYPTGGSIHSSPAIGADGIIYFGSLDHWFYAVNPDGNQKWRILSGKAGRSSPAIAADSAVYVGTDDDNIYAVMPNGTAEWEYKTDGTIHASPSLGADGTVYCGSDDGCLYALNPDGTLKWKFATDSVVLGGASIASDGTVYFGSDDNNLYALNPSGTLKWKYSTGGGVDAAPAIAADGTIYFGSNDNSVYALNPDGTAKWQFESDGAVQSSPTIGPDGKVYFTSKDGYLYALKGTSPLAGSPWPKFHHDLKNTGRADGKR